MDINKIYGLKPMTLEEEINAPDMVTCLRRSKIDIHDRCESIKMKVDTIELTAKMILEKDDEQYVELINRFERMIKEADNLLYEAVMLGKR